MNKISENMDLFMNVFHFSALGMAILSIDGSLVKVNSSFCEMVEYTKTELDQMSLREITHPEDMDFICKWFTW